MRSVFLVLQCIIATAISAQTTTIPLGTRVRIETVQKQPTSGTLISQTADTVVVAASGDIRIPIATTSIYRIRVSDGTSRGAGALAGMAYGAAILGGVVLMLSVAGDMPDMAPLFAVAGGGLRRGHRRWSRRTDRPRTVERRIHQLLARERASGPQWRARRRRIDSVLTSACDD